MLARLASSQNFGKARGSRPFKSRCFLDAATTNTTTTTTHLFGFLHHTKGTPGDDNLTINTMAPFRLLDLAAELRNRIYEESLTHDRDRGCTANVALLRVSKQVHAEAKVREVVRSPLKTPRSKNADSMMSVGHLSRAQHFHDQLHLERLTMRMASNSRAI